MTERVADFRAVVGADCTLRVGGFIVEDVHTHRAGRREAIVSLPPDALPDAGGDAPYSISLHPWHVTPALMATFRQETAVRAGDRAWVAVGECGLDALCATPMAVQEEAFRLSLATAHEAGRMTVVHCVRRWEAMMAMVRTVWGREGAEAARRAGAPIVIHGFRKGTTLAQRLVEAGFCLSVGERFQPEAVRQVPAGRLLVETDESEWNIGQIREKVYLCRS